MKDKATAMITADQQVLTSSRRPAAMQVLKSYLAQAGVIERLVSYSLTWDAQAWSSCWTMPWLTGLPWLSSVAQHLHLR